MKPRRRTSRFAYALAALAPLAGAPWVVGVDRAQHAEVPEFRQHRSEQKILGRTGAELVSAYGLPYAATRDPDGTPIHLHTSRPDTASTAPSSWRAASRCG